MYQVGAEIVYSLFPQDACTLKKIIETKKRELEHRKTNVKTSERLRYGPQHKEFW